MLLVSWKTNSSIFRSIFKKDLDTATQDSQSAATLVLSQANVSYGKSVHGHPSEIKKFLQNHFFVTYFKQKINALCAVKSASPDIAT